ncbi:MAG: TlpA disulfide reductase family protein [Verrucomicrobiota bacterium]
MWQEVFEKYGSDKFTVVGIAMDTEGIAPAKKQYERFGVTFPALVDPNYATRFDYVPWVFFVNEHGVVQEVDWKDGVKSLEAYLPVSDYERDQWTSVGERTGVEAVAKLKADFEKDPRNLSLGSELASRLIALNQHKQAQSLLKPLVEKYDPLTIARSGDREQIVALADAFLQLSRAEKEREDQVKAARLAYFVYPTKGYIKQVIRIEGPEYFDNTESGLMDSDYRSAGIRRLEAERKEWFERER